MELKILGSSSKGNSYIIENHSEAIVIEAGINFNEIKKSMNFNISKIRGVVISHGHL
jgi:metal-dependent hydrolase (beta-lactamase superfamily II)